MREFLLCVVIASLVAGRSSSAQPTPFKDLQLTPSSAIDAKLRGAILAKARGYSLLGMRIFGKDSVIVVFEDSTLTSKGLREGTWMFGPQPTRAEVEDCPPQKVLGRKIARVVWREIGRPNSLKHIVVRVQGTKDLDRFTRNDMFYPRPELERPWVGDRTSH